MEGGDIEYDSCSDGWSDDFSTYEEPEYANTMVQEPVVQQSDDPENPPEVGEPDRVALPQREVRRCSPLLVLAGVFAVVILLGAVGGTMWIMRHVIFSFPGETSHTALFQEGEDTILPKTECHQMETLTTPRENRSTWKSDDRSPCTIKVKPNDHEVRFHLHSSNDDNIIFFNPISESYIPLSSDFTHEVLLPRGKGMDIKLEKDQAVDIIEYMERRMDIKGVCQRLEEVRIVEDTQDRYGCSTDYVRYHLWNGGPYVKEAFNESMDAFFNHEAFNPSQVILEMRCHEGLC